MKIRRKKIQRFDNILKLFYHTKKFLNLVLHLIECWKQKIMSKLKRMDNLGFEALDSCGCFDGPAPRRHTPSTQNLLPLRLCLMNEMKKQAVINKERSCFVCVF